MFVGVPSDELQQHVRRHTRVIGNARLPRQALRPKVSGRTSGAGRTAGEVAADVRAARDQALARNRQVMNSDETPISLYRVYGDLMQGRDLKNSFVTHGSATRATNGAPCSTC